MVLFREREQIAEVIGMRMGKKNHV